MRATIFSILIILLVVVVYGAAIEPRWLLAEEAFEAELPGLPGGWEGQRVALVADFQIGMWGGNTGMVHKAVEDAISDSVALALIAGDFVYRPDSTVVDEAVEAVRPLVDAGIPTLAVLGNHDYSLMKASSERVDGYAEYLETQLEEIGITVLINEAVPVTAGNDSLWVAGVGSVWAGLADVDAALASIPEGAPRLWLMHNSEAFRSIPAGEAYLALAAHTHGGQIRLFSSPRRSWLDLVREGEIAADGWAADSIGAAPNRVYINRGIGFSTIPLRINCRPELTRITLRRGNGFIPDRGPDAREESNS